MAATALGNIPLSTTIYPASDVDTALQALASGVSEEIASAVSVVWKAGESKTAAQLVSSLLVAENEGYVYNLTTDATTTADWAEGAGKTILAGTDVAVIKVGTAYKFNAMAARDASVVRSVNGQTPGSGGAVTIPNAGASTNGLMTSGDHTKLSGIASGAEVNQNAFAKIAVSGVTGTGDAASQTDTLTLVPGNNVTMSRSGKSVTINATVPSGVVTGVVTDSGTASADSSGHVDIHGLNGVTVTCSGDYSIVVDASDISGIASGAQSGVTALSGVVSGLKNFSGVDVYATSGATAKTSVTAGSNAATLQIKAGNNVTLSGDNTNKSVTINASVPVKDGKISGGSSLLSGTTIVIPVATTSAKGVTQLTDSVSNSTTTAITPNAVSGAISGVNSGLATKVSGGTLHTALNTSGLANGTGTTNNTIYALINALHSVDGQSES